MQNFSLSDSIRERFQSVENELGYSEHVVSLDCKHFDTWEFRDRKAFELGNIDDLALSIKNGGQCQPIIAVKASEIFRPKDDSSVQYVVIAGYRRWMACKKHGMEVQAIIRNLNFEQAITALVAENEKENVSDYSKGMFYHTMLATEKISQELLSKRLNISPAQLSAYLSFAQIPEEIWYAVGDLSRVSAKTSATMRAIANKGTIYVDALKSIGSKIAQGFGEKRIQKAVDHVINSKMKRASHLTPIDRKIKYNGFTLMHSRQGRIKLHDSLVNNGKYNELILLIEKDITDFVNRHLTKN